MNRLSAIVVIFLVIAACRDTTGEDTVKKPEEIYNPNGDSELALVMRRLHYEAHGIKTSLQIGESPDTDLLRSLAGRLTTAAPTDSSMIDSIYNVYAGSLVQSVEIVSKREAGVVEFNAMISTCLTCHRHTCPGPIKKILKLQIPA